MPRAEKHTCSSCNGTRKCENCGGKGKVRDYLGILLTAGMVRWETCSSCNGKRKCYSCDGKGFYWSDR